MQASSSPRQCALNTLLLAATERVKRQVSDGHYQIFDLYVLQGWPPRDVAHTLGVSRGQVCLAKHRVGGLVKRELKRLQREMRDR